MDGPLKTDILIAGGGIAGLTLAALLGGAGINVAILEPAPPKPLCETPVTARTVALMESSLNILRAARVWDKVEAHSNPLETMRLIDDSRPGAPVIKAEFHARDIGMEHFGCNVPNGALRAALYETVAKIPSVKIFQTALAAFTAGKSSVRACLEDGNDIKAALIVGADGKKSRVREIANIKAKLKTYDQSAITCVIGHTKPHNNTSSEFHRPSGPFALVPMPGNVSAIVWVEKSGRADEIIALRRDDFLRLLQRNSAGLLGKLSLESNPECWPLQSLKALKLTAPRTTLIAEAAHVMSPIAAQGLNLSLRDAAALAEITADFMRLGLDPGSSEALRKFESRRVPDINARVLGVGAMNDLVRAEYGFIKGLRRRGLQAVGAISPLKKIAMRQGLAPDMDLGRLAKGGSL